MKHPAVLGLLGALSLLGCADGSESSGAPLTPQDSLLAEALATLHLAEARAEVTGADADSLRDRAYARTEARTGLDSADVAAALGRLAGTPEAAEPILARVAERLEREQRGLVP